MTNMRYCHNVSIIEKLSEYIKTNPDLRFHQILWNLGIIETDNKGEILDKYYEESEVTWKKLCLNLKIKKIYENNFIYLQFFIRISCS